MNEWKPLILVVEDDEDMALLNARLLKRQGYDVLIARTIAEARELFIRNIPDLFVLDIGLSDGDGFSLCKEFRQVTDAPVLFLTGRVEAKDKVTGLNSGGDYYLTKPYDRDEFLAVVNYLLRKAEQTRKKISEMSVVTKGPLTLKLQEAKVLLNGINMEFTHKEFAVLLLLVQNEDKELSSEMIYKTVWGAEMGIDTGLIRKHISQIKKKLNIDNIRDFTILTGYGGGYTFTAEKEL